MKFAGLRQEQHEPEEQVAAEPSVWETGSERRRTAISENIFPEVAKADVAVDETPRFRLLFLLGFVGLINYSIFTIFYRYIAAPLLSMMFDSASAAKRFLVEVGAGANE